MLNLFFPNFTKKYNSLNKDTRQLSVEDFKGKLSTDMKPFKYKHFSYGYTKHANMLITRIRVGNSYLKAHSFSKGHAESSICPNCNDNKTENSSNFFIICPRFAAMRRTLFDQIEQGYIPQFRCLSNNRQLKILLYGYEPSNPELKHINGKIMLLTQAFILKTKHFSK